MRVALYARYSTDLQRDSSIEDQIRVCRTRADNEGWPVIETYADHATSSATILRPGYQALIAVLRSGDIDVVLAESLDRFSRDLEHIASFFEQRTFHKVRIVTLAEGDISELHIGLRGTMGALFFKDLADKARRGLEGRVHLGRYTGGPAYGYSVVRKLKDSGEPDRGLRAIDPEQAVVVRRIFEAYVAGVPVHAGSPAHSMPRVSRAPAEACGSAQRFMDGPCGQDGLLRNELHIGRLVWRRRVNARDPVSGARVRRDNRPERYLGIEVPHLRIIHDELWQGVQDRMQREAAPARTAPDGTPPAFWLRRRPRHLLSGKAFCGVCGLDLTPFGRDCLGCGAAWAIVLPAPGQQFRPYLGIWLRFARRKCATSAPLSRTTVIQRRWKPL